MVFNHVSDPKLGTGWQRSKQTLADLVYLQISQRISESYNEIDGKNSRDFVPTSRSSGVMINLILKFLAYFFGIIGSSIISLLKSAQYFS